MTIKTLLAKAVDAQIAGNTQAVEEALKQAFAQRTKSILGENYRKPSAMEMEVEEVTAILNGEEYLGNAVVNIHTFHKATRGNFSPVAGDPSEFYGDPEELEFDVVSLQLYDEDGNPLPLIFGKEAEDLIPDAEMERIGDYISSKLNEPEEPDLY